MTRHEHHSSSSIRVAYPSWVSSSSFDGLSSDLGNLKVCERERESELISRHQRRSCSSIRVEAA